MSPIINTYYFRLGRIIMLCVIFILGIGFSYSQAQMNNDELLANAFYSIVALNESSDNELIKLALDVQEIFKSNEEVDANVQLIRILKFEQYVLHGKAKPLLSHHKILEAKKVFPSKDPTAAISRMIMYMEFVIKKNTN